MILSLMTSGFSPSKNAITRILVKVDGKETQFNELVSPYEKEYDSEAMEVTDLSRDVLFSHGVSLKDALFGLRRFIFENCGDKDSNKPLLMGYKILDFDIPFLEEASFDVGELFKFKILDLYHLVYGLDTIGFFAKKGIILKNHRLVNVCSALGVEAESDEAFDKVKAIEGLYGWLREEI